MTLFFEGKKYRVIKCNHYSEKLSMRAADIILQNSLPLRLHNVSLRELLYLKSSPCDLFTYDDGSFRKIIKTGSLLGPELIRGLIQKGISKVLTVEKKRDTIERSIQENLIHATRSLSVGPPLDNGKRLLNLLAQHCSYLYAHPSDDDILSIHTQSAKILCHFLMKNIDIHPQLYREFMKQKHKYVLAQPILSSLFLVGILKNSITVGDKEVENLFITSIFKDIGMSTIPIETYNQKELAPEHISMFKRHASESVNILQGRLSLGSNYFTIIENHHCFSHLFKEEISSDFGQNTDEQGEIIITGFETMVICICDIISAMISERPYRQASSLFDALGLVKDLVAEHYPQEFKIIVSYFKQFFKNKSL